jgi:hypothetical protein
MVSSFDEELKFLQECLDSGDSSLTKDGLKRAIMVVKAVAEENEVVWALIEEIKASDISMHRDLVQNELNRKIAETFSLISKQVVLA